MAVLYLTLIICVAIAAHVLLKDMRNFRTNTVKESQGAKIKGTRDLFLGIIRDWGYNRTLFLNEIIDINYRISFRLVFILFYLVPRPVGRVERGLSIKNRAELLWSKKEFLYL